MPDELNKVREELKKEKEKEKELFIPGAQYHSTHGQYTGLFYPCPTEELYNKGKELTDKRCGFILWQFPGEKGHLIVLHHPTQRILAHIETMELTDEDTETAINTALEILREEEKDVS